MGYCRQGRGTAKPLEYTGAAPVGRLTVVLMDFLVTEATAAIKGHKVYIKPPDFSTKDWKDYPDYGGRLESCIQFPQDVCVKT